MARIGRSWVLDPCPGDVYVALDSSVWVVDRVSDGEVELEQLGGTVVRTWRATVPQLVSQIHGWRRAACR
ncbi:MAG: hypothetical protein D3X82_16770 [Candidatus Leucobacter sulfamidivorax]|nr:hypothetical protein [Candidatus Leucobacter sulfamidivorax]